MWVEYELLIYDVPTLVGGLPKHTEVIRRWQETRLAKTANKPDQPTVEQAVEGTQAVLGDQVDPEEVVAGIWTGFAQNRDGQVCLEQRNVKAMLKESANIVRNLKAARSTTTDKAIPLKAKLAERVFVHPRLLPILDVDGEPIPVDDVESPERAIHVMTAAGPRTALKKTDVVRDVQLRCRLKVLNDGLITEALLRLILDHGSENGLGTDRSQGNGTFAYELKLI